MESMCALFPSNTLQCAPFSDWFLIVAGDVCAPPCDSMQLRLAPSVLEYFTSDTPLELITDMYEFWSS